MEGFHIELMNAMFKGMALEQQEVQQMCIGDPGIQPAKEYSSEVKSCKLFS